MVLLFSTSGQPVNRGKQKGENISLSLQVQNSEVACVTSTHISLARIQLHGHVWLQGNQKMQSLAGQLWAQLKLRLKEERTDNWRYWQSQPQIPCSGFISNYSFGAISGWMGVSSFSSLFRQDLGISSTCVLPSHTVCNRYNQAQQVQSGHNVMVNDLPYFWTIRCIPPQIWEENGGVSYSPNVAYLAHWEWVGGRWWSGFFFLFSSSKIQACLMVLCVLQSEKYGI